MSGFGLDLLSAAKAYESQYGKNPVLGNLLGSANTDPLSKNEMDEYQDRNTDMWSHDDSVTGALAFSATSPELAAKLIQSQSGGKSPLAALSMLLASMQQSSWEGLLGQDTQGHNPTLDIAVNIQAEKLKPFLEIK